MLLFFIRRRSTSCLHRHAHAGEHGRSRDVCVFMCVSVEGDYFWYGGKNTYLDGDCFGFKKGVKLKYVCVDEAWAGQRLKSVYISWEVDFLMFQAGYEFIGSIFSDFWKKWIESFQTNSHFQPLGLGDAW